MSHLKQLHINPTKKAALMSTSTVTFSHEKIQNKGGEKKSQRPSLTRWYPCSPKAEAFLFFGVWLQTFLPASSKSDNKPSVPWERRGAYVTEHTQEGSQGGEKMHRGMTEKKDKESASERCFQLSDEVPHFVRAMTSEIEKQNAKG